ncbi:MAG: hypothetical protein JXN65_09215 [Clostridia bacterium]|nr:hypothetical protein [Clostridia bacterium]
MKKHLNKIFIGLALIVIAALAVAFNYAMPDEQEQEETQTKGEIFEAPHDYLITTSQDLHVNADNYIHTDETVIIGTLKDIVFAGDKIKQFIIEAGSGTEYTILYSSLELISTEILQTKKENGIDEVRLVFRTGGELDLAEEQEARLYKSEEGKWTLDQREHIQSAGEEFTGNIEDFVFLPLSNKEGTIYLNSITVKNKKGETVHVYPYSMMVEQIKSKGEMSVYYAGDAEGRHIFDVKEGEGFSVEIMLGGEVFTLKAGDEIRLEKSENNEYWQIARESDDSKHSAKVKGFVFGFTDDNISSLDYIDIELDDGGIVQMTMLQMQAIFAVPHGDYEKVYTYHGHEKVLEDIEPLEGWGMELYFDDDIILDMSIGKEIWVYKNDRNIWTFDYVYTDEMNKKAEAEEDEGE